MILKKLLVYLWQNMPFSNLHLHVQQLLPQLEAQESKDTQGEAEGRGRHLGRCWFYQRILTKPCPGSRALNAILV